MRFLFLYVQGFAVRAMLFRNIKKPFGKTSLISHAFSVFVCARLHGSSNAFPQHKKAVRKDFSYQPCIFCFAYARELRAVRSKVITAKKIRSAKKLPLQTAVHFLFDCHGEKPLSFVGALFQRALIVITVSAQMFSTLNTAS